MSWETRWSGNAVACTCNGEDYNVEVLMLESQNHHTEPGMGPGENDIVLTEHYCGNNELGNFRWRVTSRLSGFEGRAEIEDISLVSVLERCTVDTPLFEIVR